LAFKIIYNQAEANTAVAGEFEDNRQIAELIELLNKRSDRNKSITFLGANMLPDKIAEKLSVLQQQQNFTIFVSKRYLYSYLHTLGIKCRYIQEQYALKKPRGNLPAERENIHNINKDEIYSFLKDMNHTYGYDYTEYQIESIMRRINIAMIRERIYDFRLFMKQVLNNEEIFDDLFLDFSINTTEFFRDH
jgi:chemotaxis protein methyltransferase CheR